MHWHTFWVGIDEIIKSREREVRGKDKGRSLFFPSNSLRKAEGCNERSGKGLVREWCQQHLRYRRSWTEDDVTAAARENGPRPPRRVSVPCGGAAVWPRGGERTAVRALPPAGAAPRPAMAAAAAGRRPVAGGRTPPLRASRRAPPPRRCGQRSQPAAPGKNRSRTGLRWRRGEGR